ncbi:MAG TPA: aspartate--tRNA ligase [Gemmatimonadaceae bacterium]|nr:aspartate--tRNA ligase [Gemmatimonadaceae bacterium]
MSEATFATTYRSHLCGMLRASDVGTRVRLGGWVHRKRNVGGLVFIDLRDRSGIVQLSVSEERSGSDVLSIAAAVGVESVVLVEGDVVARPPEGRNGDLPTGDVEVAVTALRVVGPAVTPAIPVARIAGEPLPSEELRLRYRQLDLRRAELQRNLELRHQLMQVTRRYFSEQGFLEIETPILTKPTPEGARDYLVPSRLHAGEFYALPQSPQLYKQLLMVAGFDRYFQLARCFRDEDLRADRQPEFTQIDVEASFVAPEDIYALTEGLLLAVWREAGHEIATPFPRMSYAEGMERYGTDRPDTRYGLEIFDASDLFRGADFAITRAALEQGGRVRGIRVPGGARLSRKQVDGLEELARGAGARGLLRLKRQQGQLEGPVARYLGADAAARLGLEEGDLCLLVAAADHVSSPALDRVRQAVGRLMGLVPDGALHFLWVTDFPMFEPAAEGDGLTSVHHPFTAPHPEDAPLLEREPGRVRSLGYDVVLNGTELGGGSIRISDPALQERVFALLGIDHDTAQRRFGFLLEGLRSGAPPHGGIALGVDRIAMMLAGAPSLRDVIAFPKTTAARALLEQAPSSVPCADLEALHIQPAHPSETNNDDESRNERPAGDQGGERRRGGPRRE